MWRWIQQKVDRLQKGQRNNADALDDTVRRAWEELGENRDVHKKIWDSLVGYAKICIIDEGDNTNAEVRGHRKEELIAQYNKFY